ncbi:MAG: HDIG domain-containing protein [Candidatus Gottesmanbacteria bacterium]|nr:HDIG domain-containing protein [Candidatus Gottesmanbacteria bacterium]
MGGAGMIPTEEQAKQLWEKYGLPEKKREHVALVARVAIFLATKVKSQKPARRRGRSKVKIDEKLLIAGALLHDIDKNVPKLPGERHPDAGVRILREEGMGEVADIVKTHSVHAILDPMIAPKTWEEKLLFFADKMVKQEVIGVDARFKQWNEEHLPPEELALLARAYPKVKDLEAEILRFIGMEPWEALLKIQASLLV